MLNLNSRSNYLIVFLSFLLIVFFENCKHETLQAPHVSSQDTIKKSDTTHHVIKPDSVCFSTQIYPLIISNCGMSGCHDAGSHAKGLDVSTYSKIAYYANQIYSSVNANRMPKGLPYFTSAQKALFLKWMNEGKKNTICVNNCDTSNVTFSNSISIVIQNNCLGCHNTNNAVSSGGGILLDNYQNVKTQTVTGHLLCSLDWTSTCSKMPKGNTPLSFCDIRKFIIWNKNNCPQ